MKLTLLSLTVLLSASIVFSAPRYQLTTKSSSTLPASVVDSNQDDIWAVIEFPEGKEVAVDLVGTATAPNAKGTARVSRGSNGSEIGIELTGLPAEIESYHVYTIDSLGNATTLGSLTVSDGSSSLKTQTALTSFMIVISPKDDVVSLSAETAISLRSTVPEGFKVVPRTAAPQTMTEPTTTSSPTPSPTAEYDVPLLGIGSLKLGANVQMKARLFEELRGARLNASVTLRKKGAKQIKLLFSDLKPAPEGMHYIAWTIGADNTYTLMGKVTGGKQSRVETNTTLSDFGLFITMEDSETPSTPTGKMVAMVIR